MLSRDAGREEAAGDEIRLFERHEGMRDERRGAKRGEGGMGGIWRFRSGRNALARVSAFI
jgi:hypothetical protein